MSEEDMAVAVINPQTVSPEVMEQVVVGGDLSGLSTAQRMEYYRAVCSSLKLNPLTQPFAYLELGTGKQKKLVLYAKRDCTDQIRNIHQISVEIVSSEKIDDLYVVKARARTPDGRTDESIGVVPLMKEDGEWKTDNKDSSKRFFHGNGKFLPLTGEDLANALMKCETKSKRRATLSIAGLGWLDESEVDSISSSRPSSNREQATQIVEQSTQSSASPSWNQPITIVPDGLMDTMTGKPIADLRPNQITMLSNKVQMLWKKTNDPKWQRLLQALSNPTEKTEVVNAEVIDATTQVTEEDPIDVVSRGNKENLTFPLPNGGSYSLTSAQPPTPEVDDDGEVKAGWVSVLHTVAGYYGAEVMLDAWLKNIPVLTAGQFAELWTQMHESGLAEA